MDRAKRRLSQDGLQAYVMGRTPTEARVVCLSLVCNALRRENSRNLLMRMRTELDVNSENSHTVQFVQVRKR